jgi:inositol 3-alpha-galactosyltransferase
MTSLQGKENYAYTTLITRPSYLAGVLILAYTLRKHNSKYPLVILYTDGVGEEAVKALQNESEALNLKLVKTEPLLPRSDVKVTLIAERFGDTW